MCGTNQEDFEDTKGVIRIRKWKKDRQHKDKRIRYTSLLTSFNRIGGAMVSVLASSAVDRGFEPRSGRIKDYKMAFVDSPISTKHEEQSAKTGCLGIRIMCLSGIT